MKLKNIFWKRIVALDLGILIVISLAGFCFQYYGFQKKAEFFCQSIRNYVLVSDLRSINEKILTATTQYGFLSVQVGQDAFIDRERSFSEPNIWDVKISLPILASSSDSETSVATVTFSYSLGPVGFFVFALWLVFNSILWALLPLIKRHLELNIRSEQEKIGLLKASMLAKQVAHDIRSPLSALNMAIHGLADIPEDRRLLIRNAVHRINDIANDLLQKSKKMQFDHGTEDKSISTKNSSAVTEAGSFLLLPAVIDSIISEKRIQFRSKMKVKIEVDLKDSFGTFVNANATELGRVISNLVNNAVEALINDDGEVIVAVRGYKDQAVVIIKDNGHGIPSDVLVRLGEQGVSYGKAETTSGSGLGVYHARKSIESWGGEFEIQSRQGVGTSIEIKLPRVANPSWFASSIQIHNGTTLVAVDDDLSIHQIWQDRLESLRAFNSEIVLRSFTSAADFMNLVIDDSMIFLIDYEFLNQSETGLELIINKNIAQKSILVTSRHEELLIREECARLKIRLLPKQLAGFVPIRFF